MIAIINRYLSRRESKRYGLIVVKAKPSFSLKDQLFNPEKVEYLSNLIAEVFPSFEHTNFCELSIGDKVNLEFDIIGKYVAKLMQQA